MSKRTTVIYAVFILLLMAFTYFIYRIRKPLLELLNPIFFALLIAYLFNPLVNGLENKKISRTLAITIVYVVVIMVVGLVIFLLIPQLIKSIRDLTQTIPRYFERYDILFHEFEIRYRHSDLPAGVKQMLDDNINKLQQLLIHSLQQIVGTMTGIFSFLFDIILGAVIAFYILKDKEKFKDNVISLIPKKAREWIFAVARDIDVVLSGFIRGQLLVATILSVLTIIGLWAIGIKYALILGIVAGFANIIPYFGPILGSVPAVVVAFIDRPFNALWVIILYIFIQQIESAILSPKIVGSRVGLHPAVTIIAVLAGGKFFGLIGLILSVPVAGIFKVLGHRIVKSIV